MMIDASTSPESQALDQHLQETRIHTNRLARVFSIIGVEAKTKDNDIVDELTSSAKDLIGDIDASRLRDAAIIVSGNKVEHHGNGRLWITGGFRPAARVPAQPENRARHERSVRQRPL